MSDDQRRAVVTGGGGGIGRATVERLTGDGWRVAFAEIDATRAAETAAATGATAVVADVTDPAGVRDLAAAVADWPRLDGLVNNVGHYLTPTPFAKSTPEHWDALDAINLRHVYAVTHALLPQLLGGGSIVNVSSVEGLRGYPVDPVYAATKAAVIHFTRCLALELGGRGVRVNAIGPDLTQTLQVDYSGVPEELADRWKIWAPVGRPGTAAEQAGVIAFLLSEDAAFVTGHCIPTDGGTLAGGGWFRIPGTGRWTNRPTNP